RSVTTIPVATSRRRISAPGSARRRRDERRLSRCATRIANSFVQGCDKAPGLSRRKSASPKRINPLLVRQLLHQVAGKRKIGRRDVPQELLMPAVVVESNEAVLDIENERLPLKDVRVPAQRRQTAGFTEGGAEIAHDVPVFRAAGRLHDFVERI